MAASSEASATAPVPAGQRARRRGGGGWDEARARGARAARLALARTLYVIIKAQVVVAVGVQDLARLVAGKVLELDDGLGPAVVHGVDKLVHERKVGVAAQARLGEAQVPGVGAQRRIVRARVEHGGHHLPRVDAAGGGVEHELADGDAHAVRAEVAQPQDARAVGDDHHLDLVRRPVVHHGAHQPAVLRRKVHAARAPEVGPEALADLRESEGRKGGRRRR
jgi:hypothetical protein